ncbi:S-Ena type endospore appendage [Cytobacillus sp. Hm23]
MSFNNQLKHCIEANKVFDWITPLLKITIKEAIDIKDNLFEDCVCCDFSVPCNSDSPFTIWKSIGVENVTGNFSVFFQSGCDGELVVFVNGEEVNIINEGQEFCATFADMKSIEVLCRNETGEQGVCKGELKLNIKHKPTGDEIDIKNVKCFISDSYGKRLEPRSSCFIKCKELSDPKNRKEVVVKLANGKTTTLQKVVVLKQGFVTVVIFNKKGEESICRVFPFCEIETFLLCAPVGTTVDCKIDDVICEAFLVPSLKVPNCFEVFIRLDICQNIKVTGAVKLKVLAEECNPRENVIPEEICQVEPEPPACPFF